jgi:hypothetical protein
MVRDPRRPGRRARVLAGGLLALIVGGDRVATAADEPVRAVGRPAEGARPRISPTVLAMALHRRGSGADDSLSVSVAPGPRAVAGVVGDPRPGQVVTLDAGRSTGADLRYRWIQVRGPAVEIDDPTQPKVSVRLPEAAVEIAFLLVVGNATGVDTAPLALAPVGASAAPEATPETPAVRADAGDDQVGLVGHQITLNGGRSEPRGRLAYRWLQVAGPSASSATQDRQFLTFVPASAGTYRFVLLVAADGQISEPDVVDVMVGAPGASAGSPGAPNRGPDLAPIPSGASVEDLAKSALASLEDGPALAGALADGFEAIAARAELYSTYADVLRETTLHLGAIVPDEPGRRAVWVERLFNPLTTRLVERMRLEGLDPLRPDAQAVPLGAGQKAALIEFYREAARGFRAAAPTR